MAKLYILIIILPLISCSQTEKHSKIAYNQLIRIEQFLSQKIEENYSILALEAAYDRERAGINYNKSIELRSIMKETQYLIENDSVGLRHNLTIAIFLESLKNYLDTFMLAPHFVDTLKHRHLDYWIEKDPPSPLSKEQAISIIIDLKTLENNVLYYLIQGLTLNDFNFNVIKPLICESSNIVSKREVYEAKIYMTAFDTTRHPSIEINNNKIPIEEDYGIYRFKSNSPGLKTLKGTLAFPKNDHEMVYVPIDHSFIVK
jgi:hypothetical protein